MADARVIEEPLITRYRPQEFDEVYGHDSIIHALKRAIAGPSHPHSFLLTGPKGTGKTTIARLIGQYYGCEVNEIAAAVYSKVEEARALVQDAEHMSLSGQGKRMFLLDEAHRLTANAWDALLKVIEEPPPHVYFAFCTTNDARIPATIKSRCYQMKLSPLRADDIFDVLNVICEAEGWKVDRRVMSLIVTSCEGSARQAITWLHSAHDCADLEEVRRITTLIDDGNPMIELVRMLMDGGRDWKRLSGYLRELDEADFDEVAIVTCRYLCGVMAKGDEPRARRAWAILDTLTAPVSTFDRKAALYTAVGHLAFRQR